MRNLTRLRDQSTFETAQIHVTCNCLLDKTYDGLNEFTDAGGRIESDSPMYVHCPRCEHVSPGDASYTKPTESTQEILTLDLTIGDATMPDVPVGTCPNCDTDMYAENYHKGPENPEIGWSYYECPSCEMGVSPTKFPDSQIPPTIVEEEK